MRRRMSAYPIVTHRANFRKDWTSGVSENHDGKRNNDWRRRMCLSTQALFLFISLLPQDIVEPSASEVMIAADAGKVTWENFDGEWCTVARLVIKSSKETSK